MGDRFDQLVETSRLAEQHRYEELRKFYSADVASFRQYVDMAPVMAQFA